MTNEEAIKMIRDDMRLHHDSLSGEYRQALNMAIQALEQEPCEDCISRQAVHDMIENTPIKPDDKWFNWVQKVCNRLAELPSVTPQPKIGHCKDCKWWKDSDGSYNRDIGAESQCPMNRIEVFEGTGYCFLYEPHESEE